MQYKNKINNNEPQINNLLLGKKENYLYNLDQRSINIRSNILDINSRSNELS